MIAPPIKNKEVFNPVTQYDIGEKDIGAKFIYSNPICPITSITISAIVGGDSSGWRSNDGWNIQLI